MIRGNIHPIPYHAGRRNSLGEEIKNSHPAPGPLMAGIVHVNMGHCLYYHITLRKALGARRERARARTPVLLINTGNYKTGVWAPRGPARTFPEVPRPLLVPPSTRNGNTIMYSAHSGGKGTDFFPSRAISLTRARVYLSLPSFFFFCIFFFLNPPRPYISSRPQQSASFLRPLNTPYARFDRARVRCYVEIMHDARRLWK